MASLPILVPQGYTETQNFQILAKYNKIEVNITESADVPLPTLTFPDKSEVLGIIPIAFALARATKANGKNWARTILGDGVPATAALVEQFSAMAESVFAKQQADIKTVIGQLSTHLKSRSFVASVDEPTIADVLLTLALYPAAQELSNQEKEKQFTDFVRWIVYINEVLESPFAPLPIPKHEYKSTGGHVEKGGKPKQQGKEKPQKTQQPKEDKKSKKPAQPAQPKKPQEDNRDPFSFIDVRIGKIVKVWPHPNAEKLYCEEIDIGNNTIKRVVTGVREYVPIDQMQDRHVVVFTNIKPSKIRGEPSESMVFAGSNADHTVVELLDPPADAPIGTRVVCGDFVQGEVPGVDKKGKYWEAVVADHQLTINADHLACYKGVPLSCEYGQIRVKSLANCEFH